MLILSSFLLICDKFDFPGIYVGWVSESRLIKRFPSPFSFITCSLSSLPCVERRLAMQIVQICATPVMNLTLTHFSDHESEKLRENTVMAELIGDCSGVLPQQASNKHISFT